MIKFWWQSGSRIRIWIQIRIATLVMYTLLEVYTVPVLLVYYVPIICTPVGATADVGHVFYRSNVRSYCIVLEN